MSISFWPDAWDAIEPKRSKAIHAVNA